MLFLPPVSAVEVIESGLCVCPYVCVHALTGKPLGIQTQNLVRDVPRKYLASVQWPRSWVKGQGQEAGKCDFREFYSIKTERTNYDYFFMSD